MVLPHQIVVIEANQAQVDSIEFTEKGNRVDELAFIIFLVLRKIQVGRVYLIDLSLRLLFPLVQTQLVVLS